jgi:hypothetical protein
MDNEKRTAEAAELHEYLKGKLGHNWRLETWRTKYEARLKKYGLEKCKVAVDGFASQKWWVENKSQDAPDCIFRSDKSFERFQAAGMKLPENKEETKQRAREETDKRARMAETRARLEKENKELNARLHRKIDRLRDEISEAGWSAFIRPLLYVRMEEKAVVLFHEKAGWVEAHYAKRIEVALGVKVKVVSE